MTWIIETLDSAGRLQTQTRIERLPAQIGRAVDADVRLIDDYVAPLHAELTHEAEGHLILRDLGTANGIHVQAKRKSKFKDQLSRANAYQVTPQTIYSIGRSRIRIWDSSWELAPEKVLPTYNWFLPLSVFAALTFCIALQFWQQWMTTVDDMNILKSIFDSVGAIGLGFSAWAGLWAIYTRMVIGQSRFLSHLLLACMANLAITLVEGVLTALAFVFNLSVLVAALVPSLGIAFFIIVLLHVRIANDRISHRSLIIMVGLALFAFTASMVNTYQSHREILQTSFMTHLLPPHWRLAAAQPPEQLFESAKALRPELIKMRLIEDGNFNFDFD